MKMTIKEALKQGYTLAGKGDLEWQSLVKIEGMNEHDIAEGYFLAQKYPEVCQTDEETMSDLIADFIYSLEGEWSNREEDEVYHAVRALDYSQVTEMVNKKLREFPSYKLTNIKLTL